MNRVFLIGAIIFVILVSTGCGSIGSTSNPSTTSSSTEKTSSDQVSELAVGLLHLEGTDQAVDKKLATQLLPYWQLLEELNASESTASQEISAVLEKIQTTMTAEQMNAIQNLNLTQNDIATVITEVRTSFANTTTTSTSKDVALISINGGPVGGEMPPDGGGMLINNGGVGGGVNVSNSSQQSTSSSQSSSTSDATLLIEKVIEMLETRVNT
jgi:uncharacterized protein YceK